MPQRKKREIRQKTNLPRWVTHRTLVWRRTSRGHPIWASLTCGASPGPIWKGIQCLLVSTLTEYTPGLLYSLLPELLAFHSKKVCASQDALSFVFGVSFFNFLLMYEEHLEKYPSHKLNSVSPNGYTEITSHQINTRLFPTALSEAPTRPPSAFSRPRAPQPLS